MNNRYANKILLGCEVEEANEKRVRKNILTALISFLSILCVVTVICGFSISQAEEMHGEVENALYASESLEEAVFF